MRFRKDNRYKSMYIYISDVSEVIEFNLYIALECAIKLPFNVVGELNSFKKLCKSISFDKS